jgi:superfamily II DNA/RNA helicase
LILAPTRELATQIDATLKPLAAAYQLKTTVIFGGVSQNRQVTALKEGVDIIVATPGRLEDLMKQKLLFLDAIEITVLDEADHMADLGFLPVVSEYHVAVDCVSCRHDFIGFACDGLVSQRHDTSTVLHS